MKVGANVSTLMAVLAMLGTLSMTGAAFGQLRIGTLCRVKGQEENTLHGMGLVFGLRGTGDSFLPSTAQALAQMMAKLGGPLPGAGPDTDSVKQLAKAKNVAMVLVTATVPAHGGLEGELLDCEVSAVGAKSLEGGFLGLTVLRGPNPNDARIYAVASGQVVLEGSGMPTTGRIDRGCRMERSIHNPYIKDGKVTLVLKDSHAGFHAAQEIATLVNEEVDFSAGLRSATTELAFAVDPKTVDVQVPEKYRDNPMQFIDALLGIRINRLNKGAQVVLDQRTGVIVIGEDVEILPVAITHNNLTIEAGGKEVSQFVPVDPHPVEPATTKLKALVDALNALKVPASDVIEIIKRLDASGYLYGDVTIQ